MIANLSYCNESGAFTSVSKGKKPNTQLRKHHPEQLTTFTALLQNLEECLF